MLPVCAWTVAGRSRSTPRMRARPLTPGMGGVIEARGMAAVEGRSGGVVPRDTGDISVANTVYNTRFAIVLSSAACTARRGAIRPPTQRQTPPDDQRASAQQLRDG